VVGGWWCAEGVVGFSFSFSFFFSLVYLGGEGGKEGEDWGVSVAQVEGGGERVDRWVDGWMDGWRTSCFGLDLSEQ